MKGKKETINVRTCVQDVSAKPDVLNIILNIQDDRSKAPAKDSNSGNRKDKYKVVVTALKRRRGERLQSEEVTEGASLLVFKEHKH